MKKQILSTLFGVAFLISGALSFNISNAEAQSSITIDSISDGQIICKCNFWKRCKASGARAACAQSEEGGNINCRNYDGNC